MALYKPTGRADEYAEWALNYYKGCSHSCAYCFAAGMAARFKQCASRADFHNNVTVKKTFSLAKLEREAKAKAHMIQSRVLLSFTSDPYQPCEGDYMLTALSVITLHEHGIPVQILTKNPELAYKYDKHLYDQRDAIAATLTYPRASSALSELWEPNAPPPSSRYAGLELFHDAGIPTWASLEPVIDPASSLAIIDETNRFVDHYKVGTINHVNELPEGYTVNVTAAQWSQFYHDVRDKLDGLGYVQSDSRMPGKKTYYIKESLRKYV